MAEETLRTAARFIHDADAILLCSGAGMGVDSGLGTFRGKNAGVWGPLKAMQMDFSAMSSPRWFKSDPRLAWAFWHFRHQAYTKGVPHTGYSIATAWANSKSKGYFCTTSNIDGHWIQAGIPPEKMYEVHGTVTRLQGLEADSDVFDTPDDMISSLSVPEYNLSPGEDVEVQLQHGGAWSRAQVADDGLSIMDPASKELIEVWGVRRPGGEDMLRVRESSALPVTPSGVPARPNVLMFGDYVVNKSIIDDQAQRYDDWLQSLSADTKLCVIEIGAGTAIPTQRLMAERAANDFKNGRLVRINLEDGEIYVDELVTEGKLVTVTGLGAKAALTRIDELMR